MGDASTRTVAVYLVDAHDLVREGTRAILEREPDIKVAGEQRDAAEVVRLVAACHPDVVVVGVGDEADVGLEVCQALSTALPRIPCLVVGHHRPSKLVVAAIQAGAKTGQHGDGKIFVSPVDAVYTVRTGARVQD
jgi:DNA-binding NarL/FixJ family response regulator